MPRVAPASALTARGFVLGRALAGSGRFRRKRAPISPWVLGFCAVFAGSCSSLRSPTWGKRRRCMAFRADSACETAQKFAVHRRGLRAAVGRAGAARRAGYIDDFPTGVHEASPRSCGVLMTRWMLGMLYGRFLGYGVRRSAAGAHFADYLGDESSPKWWAN